jgi:hypothetical protein
MDVDDMLISAISRLEAKIRTLKLAVSSARGILCGIEEEKLER